MSIAITLAILVAAAQLPDTPPAATCPKGLAGLACKAQRLNTALSDPSIAQGMQLFAKFAKKKPKPVDAVATESSDAADTAAVPADQPAADAPSPELR